MIEPSIFKAYDIRGKVGTELNADTVHRIGRAFANYLTNEEVVVVGRDMRPESEELANALIDGLRKQGRDVWDIGLVTTDMLLWSVGNYGLGGGAMITASHNPGEYNGIKLSGPDAVPIGIDSGLAVIRDDAISGGFDEPGSMPETVASDVDDVSEEEMEMGALRVQDVTEDYVDFVLDYIDPKNMNPYQIAIDAGNGMTGSVLPKIQPSLPLQIEEMYYELDGTFPNHEANPMKLDTLKDLSHKITSNNLDFGIAFDGDGDRMALVDEKGEPVPGSMTLALLASAVLEENPGCTVAYDMRTSWSALDLIKKNGGKLVKTKAGNPNVKAGMREEDAAFGGEPTGHLVFADNHFIDSGIIAALVAVEYLSKHDLKLSDFVAENDTYQHIEETNFEIENKEGAMQAIADEFSSASVDWLDGVTVTMEDSWFNVRPSNTEPVVRLNAEAKTEEQLDKITKEAKAVLEKYQ